ncbi:4Fe-4S binding protein [Candidatus Bathyarchaeota archaeon]|nr:4Fe-4S binding protein [Candidatus Bathyarchaeota archaeon]
MALKRHIIFEALRSLVNPFTTKYPKRPYIPQEGFRGAAEYEGDKCVGCGACSQVCPTGAITYEDSGGYRRLRLDYGVCSFCGRCEETCPWGAIYLTEKYELAVYDRSEAQTCVDIPLFECTHCGRPFFPSSQMMASIEKVDETLRKYGIAREELARLIQICPACSFTVDNMPERRMFMRRLVR